MNDTNFSLGRIILLTYIIIGSNYCSDLFSPELKNAIKNNRLVQHLILFLLITTLIVVFGNPLDVNVSNNEQINTMMIAILVYIWFVLTTKFKQSANGHGK